MTEKDVTGRDQYIIAMALAYAIEAINRLPEPHRGTSDQTDMQTLLMKHVGIEAARQLRSQARQQLAIGERSTS